MRTLVTGAGGAIGGHLVRALLDQGHEVRAVDIKEKSDWWQLHTGAQNLGTLDMSNPGGALHAMHGVEWIYHLAEDMGGIGYITTHKVDCAESIEIGITTLRAAVKAQVQRFFFSSSACIYNTNLQNGGDPRIGGPVTKKTMTGRFNDVYSLREDDAWPAQPEEGYGFSKLYMEELLKHYRDEQGLEIRIARYHNVFGEHGAWNGGKEKAPAALCRKIALIAKGLEAGPLQIWGDGSQLRSYLHVSDCVAGTIALMESGHDEPINIGSDRSISVNHLAALIETIAGVTPERFYAHQAAIGVNARNADITAAKEALGWEPRTSLEDGLVKLYDWIVTQL